MPLDEWPAPPDGWVFYRGAYGEPVAAPPDCWSPARQPPLAVGSSVHRPNQADAVGSLPVPPSHMAAGQGSPLGGGDRPASRGSGTGFRAWPYYVVGAGVFLLVVLIAFGAGPGQGPAIDRSSGPTSSPYIPMPSQSAVNVTPPMSAEERREYMRENLLVLVEHTTSEPNSAGGVDVSMRVTNKSKKTIKYIHYTVSCTNAVGDRVASEIGGEEQFSLRETGPLAPGQTSASVWSNMIYNHSTDDCFPDEIGIDYMDGTSYSFSTEDLIALLSNYIADLEKEKSAKG